MLVFTILGPEADGAHFEQAKVSYQQGSGAAAGRELLDGNLAKADVDHLERAEKAR